MRKYLPHILIISFVLLCNFGCVSTPYGSKYVGESKDGKIHGQGTKTSPDGRKYVGESKDDKYSDSEYTYSDRKKYKELDVIESCDHFYIDKEHNVANKVYEFFTSNSST